LSRDERRDQLLDVAMRIVRERGADELTLATVATAAGVSRPIAYDHFETRGGLLLALFERIQDEQVRALRDVLAAAPADRQALAHVMSATYFTCDGAIDTDAMAITAALQGSDELASRQRALTERYVDVMSAALRPHASITAKELRLRCTGLLGAAEALARERHARRASEAAVVRTLASMIVGALGASRPRSQDGGVG
jgi:AcrR family transcriptional regulator